MLLITDLASFNNNTLGYQTPDIPQCGSFVFTFRISFNNEVDIFLCVWTLHYNGNCERVSCYRNNVVLVGLIIVRKHSNWQACHRIDIVSQHIFVSEMIAINPLRPIWGCIYSIFALSFTLHNQSQIIFQSLLNYQIENLGYIIEIRSNSYII
jgi:hypothetical protein